MRRIAGGPLDGQGAQERQLIAVWVKLSKRHRELVIVYAKRLANLPRVRS